MYHVSDSRDACVCQSCLLTLSLHHCLQGVFYLVSFSSLSSSSCTSSLLCHPYPLITGMVLIWSSEKSLWWKTRRGKWDASFVTGKRKKRRVKLSDTFTWSSILFLCIKRREEYQSIPDVVCSSHLFFHSCFSHSCFSFTLHSGEREEGRWCWWVSLHKSKMQRKLELQTHPQHLM